MFDAYPYPGFSSGHEGTFAKLGRPEQPPSNVSFIGELQ
jgi:hypothetical protein